MENFRFSSVRWTSAVRVASSRNCGRGGFVKSLDSPLNPGNITLWGWLGTANPSTRTIPLTPSIPEKLSIVDCIAASRAARAICVLKSRSYKLAVSRSGKPFAGISTTWSGNLGNVSAMIPTFISSASKRYKNGALASFYAVSKTVGFTMITIL